MIKNVSPLTESFVHSTRHDFTLIRDVSGAFDAPAGASEWERLHQLHLQILEALEDLKALTPAGADNVTTTVTIHQATPHAATVTVSGEAP